MSLSITLKGLPEVIARLTALGLGASWLGGASATVGTELQYGLYVSSGTKPHDIFPKNKKALAWPAAGVPVRATGKVRVGAARSLGAGAYVFAAHVHHPGTKPNPYVTVAIAAAELGVIERMTKGVEAIIGGGDPASLRSALSAAAMGLQAEVMRGAPVKTGTLRRSWHVEVAGA